MRLIVSGDRNWDDRDYIFRILDEMHALYGVHLVIEGCARGADRVAGWPCPSVRLQKRQPTPLPGWAAERGIARKHFPAEWSRWGNYAGHHRNADMLRFAIDTDAGPAGVLLAAFHPSLQQSKGTKHMVQIARAALVSTFIFPHHDG